MQEKTRKWLEAAKILHRNPLAKVKCPECEKGTMEIRDEPFGNTGDKIDRYIICNNCGKWNVMTMHKPKS